MWCELINIIDATKEARHRVVLQAKEKEQENRLTSLQVVECPLALPLANGVAGFLCLLFGLCL